MLLHLYYRGEPTSLQPDDIIKRESEMQYTFHRNETQMTIGNGQTSIKSALMETSEFILAISLATGLEIIMTSGNAGNETDVCEWKLKTP